jgi:type IV pilus assembly protein PilY1
MNQPITAAASVGTDGFNFWIYFGTGRFFDAYDKTDDTQQGYYGIKEPVVEVVNGLLKTKYLTWNQVALDYFESATGLHPGEKGLWKVDDILVGQSYQIKDSQLTCRSGGCLPSTLPENTLYYLDRFIGGTGLDRYAGMVKTGPTPPNPPDDPCTENGCVDGWFRDFYPYVNRERNVGQATLLGGLVTYTTYQPFNDVCQAEGNAYLYGLYYRTGTAWHKNVFGDQGLDGSNVTDKLDLGRGLATTPNLHVGSESDPDSKEGPKAFVQTSTGEIKEIQQENLPINNYRTGRSKWRQCN